MSTRSGKPYHQEGKTPSRRHSSINETSAVKSNTNCARETENNLNLSNMSTESNWIVSDLTDKRKTRGTSSKAKVRNNATSTNGLVENNIENDLNISNVLTKQLKRKATLSNGTYDVIVNNTYENEMYKETEMTAVNIKHSFDGKSLSALKDQSKYVENELNSDISKQMRKKKKKVKCNKKKKQKVKAVPEALDKEESAVNGTVLKEMDTKDTNLNNSNTVLKKNNTSFDNITTMNKVKTSLNKNISSLDKSVTAVVRKNTIEKDLDLNTSNISNKHLRSRKSIANDITIEKEDKVIDTTYEKDEKKDSTLDTLHRKSSTHRSIVNSTYEKHNTSNGFKEKGISPDFDTFKKGANTRKSNVRDATFDKSNISICSLNKDDLEGDKSVLSSSTIIRKSIRRQTLDITNSVQKLDSTHNKDDNGSETKRKSQRLSVANIEHKLNTTFEKETVVTCKDSKSLLKVSKSSLISSDNSIADKSEISRISITSDDTVDDIGNITPVLVESSMDESRVKESPKDNTIKIPKAQTPLKREGTFTKDCPEVVSESPQTPGRRGTEILPTAGCTPYHKDKSTGKKRMLNITRSIEKRLSIDPNPRMTRVMFCSPVDNPALMTQEKRKIIKSNLKGSNKSFVFEERVSLTRPARKRSYTHNDVDEVKAKRTCLPLDLRQSVDRLSRPRLASTTVKPTETTPKKPIALPKSKSESKSVRTRLPNFAALHQKQFERMESLDECQRRRARRAKHLLTPTGSTAVLDRVSPTNITEPQKQPTKEPAKPKDKTDTPKKQLTLESLRPGFTRFGFKLNLDINPFSVQLKPKPKEKTAKANGITKQPLPSLNGATSGRKEVAKQVIMREKSFLEKKRNMNRSENRTIIKGVRTNRRFELQMKLRNID